MATASVGNESTNPDKQPSVFCETCEYKRTAKYCINCELSFCVTCIRVHQKMKGSQDHVVREISEPESTHEGKQLEPQLPCCFDHPGNDYTQFCTDCTCLICERCKPAHHGHSLEVITKDFGFYRNVYRKNTQRLLDTAHELEDYKSLLDRNFKNCDEAIANVEKWESELIALIIECAKKLKEELTKRKVDHQTQTANVYLNVDDALKEIDDQVANLNARKLVDQQSTTYETTASQSLLLKVKKMVHTLPPQPKIISVSDLLQGISEQEDLMSGIKRLFETTDKLSSIDVAFLVGFDIPNPKCVPNTGYKICKPSVPGRVIMHGTSMANIRIFNEANKVISEDKSDRHIWNMIALSSKKYVSIHGFSKKLFLLTNTFQSVFNETSEYGFSFDSLYPIASDRFLVYENNDAIPSQGMLKLMFFKDNQLYSERVFDLDLDTDGYSTHMAVFRDTRHVIVCCRDTICKVDLISGVSQKYDMSLCAKSTVFITSLTIDAKDNILVGCSCGIIHMFDKEVKTHRDLLKVGGDPHDMDIEVVGNRLFMSRRSKLLEYSYC